MTEKFDAAELRRVCDALRDFERRCEEILSTLGEKRSLSRPERDQLGRMYRSLKDDLRVAVHGGNRSSRAAQCFYDPAIRRALIELRPATNTHPITSRWFSAVYGAKLELSYWLHNASESPRGQ